MKWRTKVLGRVLYWLRERVIDARYQRYRSLATLDHIVDCLDRHAGVSYWRKRYRGN